MRRAVSRRRSAARRPAVGQHAVEAARQPQHENDRDHEPDPGRRCRSRPAGSAGSGPGRGAAFPRIGRLRSARTAGPPPPAAAPGARRPAAAARSGAPRAAALTLPNHRIPFRRCDRASRQFLPRRALDGPQTAEREAIEGDRAAALSRSRVLSAPLLYSGVVKMLSAAGRPKWRRLHRRASIRGAASGR